MTLTWLGNGKLKKETGTLFISATNKVIRTNYIKVKIYRTQQNNKCMLYREISNGLSFNKPMTQTKTKRGCNIIIIIMSCPRRGYPWPSIATYPYRSSPLACLQCYIPYPHIATVRMFELVVLLLPGYTRWSIGVHHLWARPCFSSSVLHVWFV